MFDDICYDIDRRRNFSKEDRFILWGKQGGKTHDGVKILLSELFTKKYEVDHILAHSKGGKTDLSNARLVTREYNRRKGNRDESLYIKTS